MSTERSVEEIAGEIMRGLSHDVDHAALPKGQSYRDAAVSRIASALRAERERKVPPGHVLYDGVVRKVLGTLPVTEDGCVVGEMAECWRAAHASMTAAVRPDTLTLCFGAMIGNPTMTRAVGWFATRAAAEAAAKEVQGE